MRAIPSHVQTIRDRQAQGMCRDPRGQVVTEYALVVAVLALGVAGIFGAPWIWRALQTIHATISWRVAQ